MEMTRKIEFVYPGVHGVDTPNSIRMGFRVQAFGFRISSRVGFLQISQTLCTSHGSPFFDGMHVEFECQVPSMRNLSPAYGANPKT